MSPSPSPRSDTPTCQQLYSYIMATYCISSLFCSRVNFPSRSPCCRRRNQLICRHITTLPHYTESTDLCHPLIDQEKAPLARVQAFRDHHHHQPAAAVALPPLLFNFETAVSALTAPRFYYDVLHCIESVPWHATIIIHANIKCAWELVGYMTRILDHICCAVSRATGNVRQLSSLH